MEQYNENQYDDDLTIGLDDYEERYQPDTVDLFEFSAQEESPISRLKSLILSIDWEITDEVLMQFNEELVDLRDIWADEKINLVYIQALEKISKYIYQQKAEAHPNAIKLLLTFYYNLEKIVSSGELSEQEKKDLLLEDVKKFEYFKQQVVRYDKRAGKTAETEKVIESSGDLQPGSEELLNLKATVLGIDWEITEEDLKRLREEVVRLETKFAGDRPKLILLQGIGTLGAYIKVKKSNAHADAFTLLHLFFESLEKIVTTSMTFAEEKEVLFNAVEKFNTFKELLGATISEESLKRRDESDTQEVPGDSGEIQPALADFDDEETIGFQEEEEAQELGLTSPLDVSSHIDQFFGDAPEEQSDELSGKVALTEALQGVDVEEGEKEEPVETVELEVGEQTLFKDEPDVDRSEDLQEGPLPSLEDKELALQGVDVETEADDDSGEDPLPVEESGELAPALTDSDEESLFSVESLEDPVQQQDVEEKLEETLNDFFVEDDEVEAVSSDHTDEIISEEQAEEADTDFSEQLFEDTLEIDDSLVTEDLRNEEFEDSDELDLIEELPEVASDEPSDAELPAEAQESEPVEWLQESLSEESDLDLAPALEEISDEDLVTDERVAEESFDTEDEELFKDVEDDVAPAQLSEESADVADDTLAATLDQSLDSFFGMDEGVEEAPDDDLLFSLPEDEPEPGLDEAGKVNELEGNEEEVVFELVEEGDFSDGESIPLESLEEPDEIETPDDSAGEDPLASLGVCLSSIELELDDKVIQGIFSEINHLRQLWADRTLEKTFLQLLSTVAQHIDQFRLESSNESFDLLKDNYNTLRALSDKTTEEGQEMLLRETAKVLAWQQEIISALVSPVESTGSFDEQVNADVQGKGEDSLGDEVTLVSSDIHEEIVSLRKTLQEEIASLKEELKKE
ncbi:hypothetical protein [Desulfomarina sp.]